MKFLLGILEFLLVNLLAYFLSGILVGYIIDAGIVGLHPSLRWLVHLGLVLLLFILFFLLKFLLKFLFWTLVVQLMLVLLLSPGWQEESGQFSMERCLQYYKQWLLPNVKQESDKDLVH